MVKGVTANNVTQHAGRHRRPVPAQSRRPADHAARRRLGLRSAEGQPRGDRRVPDRHQHVRHHAGPVDRHAGAGDLPLGHQRPAGVDLRLLPQRHAERAGSDRAQGAAVPEPAGRRHRRRTDRAGHGCTSSGRTNTSGSRRTSFLAPTRLPNQTFEFETKDDQQELSGPRRLSRFVLEDNTLGPRPALGVQQPVLDLERHVAPVHGRQPDSRTRPTSAAPGRTSSAPT